MYRLQRILHPEIFQGKYQKDCYFEGWYFKIIDKEQKHALAVIPGISINKEDCHVFIQILNLDNQVNYIRYPLSDFEFNENRFEIRIRGNEFTRDHIKLDISEGDVSLYGQLEFDRIVELPWSIFRPGIMGPFSYLTFLECYHGVINIHHRIEGKLELSGEKIDFSNGYGYIEKDWGKSFPEHWVWLQSNHFGRDDVTIMFSRAKIPFMGTSFEGFLCFLRLKGKVFLFATYNGAKLRNLTIEDRKVRIKIETLRFRLELVVIPTDGGELMAPKLGVMNRKILESINAVVNVRFSTRSGKILYAGKGTNTGLDIVL